MGCARSTTARALAREQAPERDPARPARVKCRAIRPALCGLIFSIFFLAVVEAQVPKEYQVKAGLIFQFTRFVEWPKQKFSGTNDPIVIGVLGKNPFGPELENATQGRKTNGREFVIRAIDSVEAAKKTHLLFIGADYDRPQDVFHRALKGCGVLTIGESDSFFKQGGIISFIRAGDNVHFKINMDAADDAGLKISSHLQKLAKQVQHSSSRKE